MRFNWKEFHKLAQFLSVYEGPEFDEEAGKRSAVSRCYFAAFCFARNFAESFEGFRPTHSAKDHKLLREHFRSLGRIKIAFLLDDLRGWRNFCDYDDKVKDLDQKVRASLKRSQKVFGLLERSKS